MKKIINMVYDAGVFLLLSLGILLLITAILWIINIPITILNLPVSLFCGIVILWLKEKKKIIGAIIIGILVLIISIFISGQIFDQSYDGNSYHKETIGRLKNGWNPLWDDYEKFTNENKFSSEHQLWAEHYPKANWIIGSSVYILTGNIETAKCYNILIIFIGFSLFFKHLCLILKNKYIALIISLLVCINPVMMSQILSLYVDGFLGILLFIIMLEMYLYINGNNNYKLYLTLSSAIILIINVKFTGLAYAGIFCLGYYLYYLFQKISDKKFCELKKSIIYFCLTVLLGVLIAGSSSYVKNFIDHNAPLYPLIGKNKVDIITYLQPASFLKMSPLEKNYYSIFSKTANIGVFNNGEPVLKIPFTFYKDELTQISYDTRIGGYGLLFSGIFLISLLIIIIYLFKLLVQKNYKSLLLISIPMVIIIFLILLLSDGWWARYAPYLYFIVIISITILGYNRTKKCRLLFILYALLIFINSVINLAILSKNELSVSGMSKMKLEELEGTTIELCLENNNFSGIIYNLNDYNIGYEISEKNDCELKLYGNYANYSER